MSTLPNFRHFGMANISSQKLVYTYALSFSYFIINLWPLIKMPCTCTVQTASLEIHCICCWSSKTMKIHLTCKMYNNILASLTHSPHPPLPSEPTTGFELALAPLTLSLCLLSKRNSSQCEMRESAWICKYRDFKCKPYVCCVLLLLRMIIFCLFVFCLYVCLIL